MYTVLKIISSFKFVCFFIQNQSANRTELSMNQSLNTFTNKSNKYCKYNNVNAKKRRKQKCTLLNASSLYIVEIFHL